jgi:hypothetical protein
MDDVYNIIYKNSEYEILRNKSVENVCKIRINNPSNPLLSSIKKTNLLVGVSINNFFTEITFQAHSVFPLKEFIKKNNWRYEKTLELILSLTKQIFYLKKQENSYYGLDLDLIVVINENIFLQISTELLVPLTKEHIQLHSPFSKKIFISPELFYLYKLPDSIHFKTIYYSIGSLCIYLLFQKKLYENENIDIDIKSVLSPIQNTKLYWFLLRTLEKDIEKRSLLYI